MDDYLMEKKIELLIDMKVKKLISELESAKSQIQQMSSEMSVLHNKVERLNSASVQISTRQMEAPDAPHFTQNVSPEQPRVMPSSAPPQKKEMYNQRMGDLKPGDVNIEKMFYYGNKR